MTRQPDRGSQHGRPALAVTVVRSGGFAGLMRRWRVEADAGDADRWVALIEQCPWGRCPQAAPAGPDRFTWEVAVDGARQHHAELPEQHVTGPWRTLIDAVRDADASAAPPEP